MIFAFFTIIFSLVYGGIVQKLIMPDMAIDKMQK